MNDTVQAMLVLLKVVFHIVPCMAHASICSEGMAILELIRTFLIYQSKQAASAKT